MKKKYETILLLNPEIGEEGLIALVEKYCASLENAGVEVEQAESWGKRPLPHQTKAKTNEHAHYVSINFFADNGELLSQMNQQYILDANILMFQTHRLDLPQKTFKLNKRLQAVTDEPVVTNNNIA